MPNAAVASKPALREGERVMAAIDLPRVPKGTFGTVTMVSGLSWIRYWVRFDNGQRIGTLHRDKLVNEADHQRSLAPAETAAAASGGATSGAGEAGGAAESVGGVPAYLLERSKAARARWAAKQAG
jgi:hypothetical protein